MLIVVLTYIALYQTMTQGLLTILVYGLGMSIPLIVIRLDWRGGRENNQGKSERKRRTCRPDHRLRDYRDRHLLPVPGIQVTPDPDGTYRIFGRLHSDITAKFLKFPEDATGSRKKDLLRLRQADAIDLDVAPL